MAEEPEKTFDAVSDEPAAFELVPWTVGKEVGDGVVAAVADVMLDFDDEPDGGESVSAGMTLALAAANREVKRREVELYELIDQWVEQKLGKPEGYGVKWNLGKFRGVGEKREISVAGENLVVSGISQVQHGLDAAGGRLDLVYLCSLKNVEYRQTNEGLSILIPQRELDELMKDRKNSQMKFKFV